MTAQNHIDYASVCAFAYALLVDTAGSDGIDHNDKVDDVIVCLSCEGVQVPTRVKMTVLL